MQLIENANGATRAQIMGTSLSGTASFGKHLLRDAGIRAATVLQASAMSRVVAKHEFLAGKQIAAKQQTSAAKQAEAEARAQKQTASRFVPVQGMTSPAFRTVVKRAAAKREEYLRLRAAFKRQEYLRLLERS